MKLRIYKDAAVRLPARKLARLFEIVTAGEARKAWQGTVNLILTTDRSITALNRQYRNLDGATDVLSFNIDPPTRPEAIFGEIYIAVPYLRRQARQLGRGLWEELLLLFCHGLLHLFGHDHADRRSEKRMFARQRDYLRQLEGEG